MKRRSFLQLLGIAPAAVAAKPTPAPGFARGLLADKYPPVTPPLVSRIKHEGLDVSREAVPLDWNMCMTDCCTSASSCASISYRIRE